MEGARTHNTKSLGVANFNYRGRVRTGCLTCRARKVKCDEQRPSCQKCTRLKRACVYKTSNKHRPSSTPTDTVLENIDSQTAHSRTRQELDLSARQGMDADHLFDEQLFFLDEPSHSGTSQVSSAIEDAAQPLESLFSPPDADAPLSNHHRVDPSSRRNDLNVIESPFARFLMTSQDIYLCTTIDLLAASEMPTHPSFSYFVEEVNFPVVSPYDYVNWGRMKIYVTELGTHDEAVAVAISAVQALYKAQVNGLPMSQAMSVYQAATTIFETMLDNDALDFHTILVVAFLLSLSEIIVPNETGSVFGQSDGAFVTRLKAWTLNGYRSPVSLRIEAWLQLLHAAARRGGNPGLLSDTVSGLLSNRTMEVPSLSLLDHYTDAATSIYDIISAPIFTFYLELQKISTQIANLSHYHRSRITSADQEEVSQIMAGLKIKMSSLWEARPGPLRFEPSELRAHFSPMIAEPLIALVGICIAAYYTEVVETGRTLSDPPFASAEAKQAMCRIRDIVEGDWNTSSGSNLNSGYLRPLFLYAIESIHRDDTQWAVERLKQIKNPICRSDFFASFAEALAEAQRSKGRRVTTKYFCYQTFGVPPPGL